MDIDFTKYIVQQKERDTLYKPFPAGTGFALFAKTDGGEFMKVLFSNKETLESFLRRLGFDWGPEKGEFLNFDSISRILKRYPELEKAEEAVAADPQNSIPEGKMEVKFKIAYRGAIFVVEGLKSVFNMSDHPAATEIREVDHPLHYDESNYNSTAKKPDFLKKKKDDKKGDKKGDKKDGKEEEGKDDKKLPPWLKKKKSKAKNYSKLWRKVKKIIKKETNRKRKSGRKI